MLTQYSNTHESFFGDITYEFTGKINKQYNNIQYYFDLKQTNAQLVAENNRLRNLLAQNFQAPDSSIVTGIDSTFKDSLKLPRKFTWLPAKVVGNTVTLQNNYLTIERGKNQGVDKGMAVVGPNGIVGVVVDASENYAKVMSLLHRSSKVSGMLKKTTQVGTIEWDGENPQHLIMNNIPKSTKLKVGDTVLTSYYSSNFPPNLMIGTVLSWKGDAESPFFKITLKTSTDFLSIQYVNVVANKYYKEQTELEQKVLKNQ